MNVQRILSIVSLLSLRSRVLAVVVMLLFGGNTVFGSGIYLRDTMGVATGEMTNVLRDQVMCLNRELSGGIFRLALRIARSDEMADDESWGTGDWTFPDDAADWEIESSVRYNEDWDEVVIRMRYDFLDTLNQNVDLGGLFSISHVDWGVREINLPLLPSSTPVDIIIADTVLCQGRDIVFRTPVGGNTSDPSWLDDFERFYRWSVYTNASVSSFYPDRAPADQPSVFTIYNFDPAVHHRVSVRRAFCNPHVFGNPDHSVELVMDLRRGGPDNRIPVFNPPLPNAQDTLFRLDWYIPENMGQDPPPLPFWRSIAHSSTVCVNFDQAPDEAPEGFLTPAVRRDVAMTAGYLFFQVGTVVDTFVRYIWSYDTALLERVFVGEALEDGTDWWEYLDESRWRTLIDDPEDDDWLVDNFGGFGQRAVTPEDSAAGVQHSFRAAFRVRALPEDHPYLNRFDSIIVRVIPQCFYCYDEVPDPDNPGGFIERPFQNREHIANVGHAWDTVRPMNQFDVRILDAGFIGFDTVCIGERLTFEGVPHAEITADGYDWWRRDSLRLLFNITTFHGYASTGVISPVASLTDAGAARPDSAQLTGTATRTMSGLVEPYTPQWRVFTPRNDCFRRVQPTTVVQETNAAGRPEYRISSADSIWHSIATFFVKQAPRALVIDPVLNRALRPFLDTIFICRYYIMNNYGDETVGSGREFILGVGTRSADGSPVLTEDPELVRNPTLPDCLSPITPPDFFHGFFYDWGESGNPIGITSSFADYELNDPYQRTRISFLVTDAFTEDVGHFTFAAQNVCGRGDSIHIPFVIIDTIALNSVVNIVFDSLEDNMGITWSADGIGVAACEGARIFHRVEDLDDLDRSRGARVQWWFPDTTWFGGTPDTVLLGEERFHQLPLTFGREPGVIAVNAINLCGGSQRIFSPEIVPIPYFRAADYWLDFHADVCQDSSYLFLIERDISTIEYMDTFFIQFPHDWNITRHIPNPTLGGLLDGRGNSDTITREQYMAMVGNDGFFFDVRVNDSVGGLSDILVRWMDQRCDVAVEIGLSGVYIPPRPAFWDTTHVFTHTYPGAPLRGEAWHDTVCSRDTLWFSVEPAPKDVDQSHHAYIWTFPSGEGWEIIDWNCDIREEASDSVLVVIGLRVETEVPDTITVRAVSMRCTDNEFVNSRRDVDILRLPILVMDTAVFDMAYILDAVRDDQGYRFSSRICTDEALRLFVDRPYSVDSVSWMWGVDSTTMAQTLPPDGETRIFDRWHFTNKNALPDTLAIRDLQETSVSTSPLWIRATLHNRCGASQSPAIDIQVVGELDDAILRFIEYETIFCEGDTIAFRVEFEAEAERFMNYTSDFVWFIPWLCNDTISRTARGYLRMIAPPLMGSVGESIWVKAINSCSESPSATPITIEEVTPAPRAPEAVNFGRDYFVDLDGHYWLLDTVCLRQRHGWRIALDDADVTYTGDWAPFQWQVYSGDQFNEIGQIIGFPLPNRDTVDVLAQGPGTPAGLYTTGITVSAVRERCPAAPGEALRILLTSIDTIPIPELGAMVYPTANLCPGDIIGFSIPNCFAAVSYRWILPSNDTTWRFADTDTAGCSVQIVVGLLPARIGLITTLGEFCDLENRDTLWSTVISPTPTPAVNFLVFPTETVCQGVGRLFVVEWSLDYPIPTGGLRWVFPPGWTQAEDTLTSNFSINIPAGASSGLVRVAGGIYINGELCFGRFAEDSVHVYGTPEIEVYGELAPCHGTTQRYTFKRSDPSVNFTFNYVVEQGSATVRTIAGTSQQPDEVEVVFTGDVTAIVHFNFTNIHNPLCAGLTAANYSVTLTTHSPELFLYLNNLQTLSIDSICVGAEYIYVASERDNSAVGFIWNIPSTWDVDTTLSGDLLDTLRITFNSVLPENAVLGEIRLRGIPGCGVDTAEMVQQIFIDTVALPAVLDAANGNQPVITSACGGQTLILFAQGNPLHDSTFWQWDRGSGLGNDITPGSDLIYNGWRFADPAQAARGDTLALITPNLEGEELNIAINVRNRCGVIRTVEHTLVSSDPIVDRITFATSLTEVCFGEETTFVLNYVANAAVYFWHFSWTTEVDTVHNSLENRFVVPQTGYIWVVPANGCGLGPISDSIAIQTVLSLPSRLVPENFAFDNIANVGRDTFCLQRTQNLTVRSNDADASVTMNRFEWFPISGETVNINTIGTGQTATIGANLPTALFEKRSTIGVAAIREGCNYRGDTLRIDLILVDTVPLTALGNINVELFGVTNPCPGSEVTFSVQNNVAWAYRWILPAHDNTWSFVDPENIFGPSVQVIVGETAAQIGVVTRTGPRDLALGNNFCDYENRYPLLSAEVTPVTPPAAPVPSGTWVPDDTICAGSSIWLSVVHTANHQYIWTFPAGWEILTWGAGGVNSHMVHVVAGPRYYEVDTIFVRAVNNQCVSLHSEEYLRMPIVVWDTAVFSMDLIRDAERGGAMFGQNPCENSTLRLFVDKPHAVYRISWRWGIPPLPMADAPPAYPHVVFGWYFADINAWPDTFALMPRTGAFGGEPFTIEMTMHNICGTSTSPLIALNVVREIDPLASVNFTAHSTAFCLGDSALFAVTPVQYADQYIWHFPWAPYTDTINYPSRYLHPQATGEVWVQALNNCSYTDPALSQRITITEIEAPPVAPIAENFMDTVCLRRESLGWTITHPDVNLYAFRWFVLEGNLSANIEDLFYFVSSDSTEVNVLAHGIEVPAGIYNTRIGIAARRGRCPAILGDTLEFVLTHVDTIPIGPLSPFYPIIIQDPDPLVGFHVPGDIIEVSVSYDGALSYRWILPEDDPTWRFESTNPLDNAGPTVRIVVGMTPTQIGVVTRTGPHGLATEDNFCDFENAEPLWSETIQSLPPPLAPIPDVWSDTVCLGETVLFSVLPNPGDTPPHDHCYIWSFPNDWTITWYSENKDSVRVLIGKMSEGLDVDTVKVQARRSFHCGINMSFNEELEILRMPIVVWTTVPFYANYIWDLARPDSVLVRSVCRENDLRLFVDMSRFDECHLANLVAWRWGAAYDQITNDAGVFPGDNLGDWSLWMDNDTLVMRLEAGSDLSHIFVQFVMENRCGYSYSLPIELGVVAAAITDVPITFTRDLQNVTEISFCENETHYFFINPIADAIDYAWHFPWYPYRIQIAADSIELTIPREITGTDSTIWVQAINMCDTTSASLAFSHGIRITKIVQMPRAPIAVNFGLTDTVCASGIYSDRRIAIHPDDEDGENWVAFNWMLFDGGDITDFFTFADSDSNNVFDIATGLFGEIRELEIGVTAARERCPTIFGDTLRIVFTSVDTIPVSQLGAITPVPDFPTGYQPCPETIVTFAIENDIALSYRWILPSNDTTWRFADDDTLGYSVRIIIGENPARIGIVTTTRVPELDKEFCGYENAEILWSDMITPLPPPAIVFPVDFFVDGICAGQTVAIVVESYPASPIDMYHFTVIKHEVGSTNYQTLNVTTDENALPLAPFNDGQFDSITVIVTATSTTSCPHLPPRVSDTIKQTIRVFNSPMVSIRGDIYPCENHTILYTIALSDANVTFDFRYLASSGVVVETIPYGEQPQTIEVYFGGDSVHFVFYNISHSVCNFDPVDSVAISIGTSEAPVIPFVLTPSSTLACMGDVIMFSAETVIDYEYDVEFIWVLPSLSGGVVAPWAVSHFIGATRDTAFLIVAEYIQQATQVERYDTITVFARGICGVSPVPQIAVVRLGTTPTFNIDIFSDLLPDDVVCEGDELKVWVDTTAMGVQSIRWTYLETTVEGTDTLRFLAPRDDFRVYVQFFIEGTCGYSEKLSYIAFNVHNLPAIPEPVQVPFPCGDYPFEMTMVHDAWTDSIRWSWDNALPPLDNPNFFEIFTRYGSTLRNDSLYFPDIGMLPFTLIATAYNSCGTQENAITITPSDFIEPFPANVFDNLLTQRFCFGDTVIVDINVPFQHTNTRPIYNWTYPAGWELVRDSFISDYSVKRIWLIPGEESGTITLYADAGVCGTTDVVESDVLVPTILRIATAQSTDTTEYANTEVLLFVYDVGVVSGAGANYNQGVENFNFFWTPAERFLVSDGGDTANLRFAFMATETFVVKAVERNVSHGQPCTVRDTVYLYVLNSYEFTVNFPEIVCRYAYFPLEIIHTGGEPTTYAQQWFVCDSIYEGQCVRYARILPSDVSIIQRATGDSMNFKVVGMNELHGDVDGFVRVPVFDTLRFTVKTVDPLEVNIDASVVRIVGNRADFIREFNPDIDSLALGENLRFVGRAGGRPDDYPHFIFEWAGDFGFESERFSPDPPRNTDTVFSGTIFLTEQLFFFAVEDTAAFGCFSMDSIYVFVREFTESTIDDDNVFGDVPNAFTPHNQDGINDIFMPGVDEITILNRWGVVIFHAEGEQAREGWDGRESRSNRMVDRGDYFFIITIHRENVTISDDSSYIGENRRQTHTKTGVVTVL